MEHCPALSVFLVIIITYYLVFLTLPFVAEGTTNRVSKIKIVFLHKFGC